VAGIKDKSYTLFLLGTQIKNLTLREAELGEKFETCSHEGPFIFLLIKKSSSALQIIS